MRIRLLIPVVAALALSACGERPTPKPPLPSRATAPIAPAAAPVQVPASEPAALACPPQPAPVCPPAATAKKAAVQKAVVKKAKVRKTVHRQARHYAPPPVQHYAYKRHHHHHDRYGAHHGHGERRDYGYAERDEAYRDGAYRDGAYRDDRYAYPADDHYHAYGQSGAVEHFARRDDRRREDRRMDDRYSGGGYSYERRESYSERDERHHGGDRPYRDGPYHDGYGGGSSYSYSERGDESGRSRYSERYEEYGGYARTDHPRPGPGVPVEAAGRDENGFLTWPGKVPAAPY